MSVFEFVVYFVAATSFLGNGMHSKESPIGYIDGRRLKEYIIAIVELYT